MAVSADLESAKISGYGHVTFCNLKLASYGHITPGQLNMCVSKTKV
uniref:Uncharacterized protein n=1 Tax=Arundo donax TaxID=35708 RepID=A0A0A9CJK7_ARUDO